MATTKIRSSSITDGQVSNADLSAAIAVTGGQIAADAITTAKILDNNVTIAKIAGSATAAADTFLKKDGTWAEAGGGGTSWQSVKTGDFTAVAGEGYPCNTTAGRITGTLPTSPSVGDTIEFLDYAGTFDTNPFMITPAVGDKIKSEALSVEMIKERSGAALTFVDATQGWVPSSGINEGTAAMSTPTYDTEALITAGGGGGTANLYNGGGGAGGLLYYGAETPKTPNGVAFAFSLGSVYTVNIGAGGTGAANGSDTVFSGTGIVTQTAVGGGQGDAVGGGSGGGKGHGAGGGGGGTAGQGNTGGSGTYCAPSYPGGGGGGAGAAGGAAGGCTTPGNGGAGLDYVITGASVNYAAGGGGGNWTQAQFGTAGGDSAGAGNVSAPDGRGGGAGVGKDGGDGCVILRMLTTNYSGTTSGSPAVTTDGSYTILNFTVSGTYTA